MKEKVLTREKLRNMAVEVISVDSSSEEAQQIQQQIQDSSSAKEHVQNGSESQERSQLPSGSGSQDSDEESPEQNILQNLAPAFNKGKKSSGLLRLRGLLLNEDLRFQLNFEGAGLAKLQKSEVDALYQHLGDNPSHSDEPSEKKEEKGSPEKTKKEKKSGKRRRPSFTYSQEQRDNEEANNQQPKKKPKLMQELEADLVKPTEQLSRNIDPQEKLKRKRQSRKKEYNFQKKEKELKIGKKKDKISNTVFNAIEDYFN